MFKRYFVKEISFNKGRDFSEDVFARKNSYMFPIISNFKLLDVNNYIRPDLRHKACASQWIVNCKN